MTYGYFRYNNSNASSVSQIYIHDGEWVNTNVEAYLLTWDNSTSTVKGHIIIKSNNIDDATFLIYQLNSLTDQSGYVQYNVTYVAGSDPSNGEACVIEFIPKGDAGSGTSGTSGANGLNGNNGVNGNNGTSGTSGVNGLNGNNGINGNNGTSGTSGSTPNVANSIYNFPNCVNCSAGDYVRYCAGDDSGAPYYGMCFGA